MFLLHEVSRNQFWADFSYPQFIGNIWWTVVWLKCNSVPIILTVNRWSTCTRSRILSIFTSVLETKGLQPRGSSSIDSLPSANALHHRNTWTLDKTLSPQACQSFADFSVALCPSLKQNLIANCCSICVTHCQNALAKPASVKQPLWATNVTLAWFNLHWWHITCSPTSPPSPASPVLPHRTLHYQSHYFIYTLRMSTSVLLVNVKPALKYVYLFRRIIWKQQFPNH